MKKQKADGLDWHLKYNLLCKYFGTPTADYPGGLLQGGIRVWWHGAVVETGYGGGDITGHGTSPAKAVNNAWDRATTAKYVKYAGEYFKWLDNKWQVYYLTDAERCAELCDL